ncbi:MAG: hypothetical protein IJC39_01830 [Firmicutes bacterium]|nr:hypothetical protein [Bacillota bacterium]
MAVCSYCGKEYDDKHLACPDCEYIEETEFFMFRKKDKENKLIRIFDTKGRRAVTTYKSNGMLVIKGCREDEKAVYRQKKLALMPTFEVYMGMPKPVTIKQTMQGFEMNYDGYSIVEHDFRKHYSILDAEKETMLELKRRGYEIEFDINVLYYDFPTLCIAIVIALSIINTENYKPLGMSMQMG